MNRKPLLTVLAIAAMLVACSSEPSNNSNNTTANNDPDMGNNPVEVDNTGTEYASEYEFLFDSLAFKTAPANKLNTLLNANLDLNLEFPIIVLLKLSDVDAAAGTVVLEGGSGLKTDDITTFIFDPDSDSTGTAGTLDAATGEFAASLEYFGFVATFKFENDVSKTVLPINKLTLSGQMNLSEDGATANVVNGVLAGYMTKEDGDATLITLAAGGNPISITQVFKEDTLNYDTTTAALVDPGMGDAWFLEGSFTAKPTVIND